MIALASKSASSAPVSRGVAIGLAQLAQARQRPPGRGFWLAPIAPQDRSHSSVRNKIKNQKGGIAFTANVQGATRWFNAAIRNFEFEDFRAEPRPIGGGDFGWLAKGTSNRIR
jgi:hypothetical protein